MNDPTSQLRSATRRAKSDVANKLISMFLHELSRKICHASRMRIESVEYGERVRKCFGNCCPYCGKSLIDIPFAVEHLDGMNRYRGGLHIPGNVLVACKRCNGEKRRDDGRKTLTLARYGWESFLCHDGSRCVQPCATCNYWMKVWPSETERNSHLAVNIRRIQSFRKEFVDFETVVPTLSTQLPIALTKLYSDCQAFAESEISILLKQF